MICVILNTEKNDSETQVQHLLIGFSKDIDDGKIPKKRSVVEVKITLLFC